MKEPKIQTVNIEHPLYPSSLKLRDEVLRKPLGLDIKNDDLSDEINQIHFVASLEDKVLGVVVLKKANNTGKLRQMAVNETLRGQQMGRKLVNALEAYAKDHSLKEVKLNARHYAVGFYEKLGYSKTTKPLFQEVGIDHYEMAKSL